MARLIDADALKETLSDLECEANNADFQSGMDSVMRDFMPKVIDAQPTAEPKRGRRMFNEQKNGYLWKCSNCKGNFDQQFSYCPYCGAKMEGGC